MNVIKVPMAWILSMLPLTVKVLQSEEKMPEKTGNVTFTELVPYFRNLDPIPEIADTKPTSDHSDMLNTKSGDSHF